MKKVQTLVTVTCSRDKWFMCLQAHSLKKFFVSPMNHIVIIEDSETPIEEWRSLLESFYDGTRKLTLISKDVYPHIYPAFKNDKLIGWHRQQILKFNIAKDFDFDQYVILDSKDIFVKRFSSKMFLEEGNGIPINSKNLPVDAKYHLWAEFLSKKLNRPIPKKFWWAGTPFTVKTEVVKEILKTVDMEDLYLETSDGHSEFFLYRFFRDVKIRGDAATSSFCGYQDISSKEKVKTKYRDSAIFQIHRTALADKKSILIMERFLEILQFDTEIVSAALRNTPHEYIFYEQTRKD